MSSTRTAGREQRSPGARTARTTRTARTASRRTVTTKPTRPEAPDEPVDDLTVDSRPEDVRRGTRSRVAGPERRRSPRHRMLLACTAVLAAGFFAVLLLNTVISQGAFRQHELEIQLILLAEQEEALAREVQAAETPVEVERAARKLGMVPAASPVFLRLSDGEVLGEPVPAPPATGKVSFFGAPRVLPTPRPTASAETSAPGIDPALDPATGLDDVAPIPVDEGAASPTAVDPADEAAAEPQASPAPVPSPQGEDQ